MEIQNYLRGECNALREENLPVQECASAAQWRTEDSRTMSDPKGVVRDKENKIKKIKTWKNRDRVTHLASQFCSTAEISIRGRMIASLHMLHLCVSHLLLQPVLRITSHSHRRIPVQPHLLAREEAVDLFEGEIACLWVEEVDDRQKAKVEDGKVDVRAVADAGDADWSDFNNKEGEDPYYY